MKNNKIQGVAKIFIFPSGRKKYTAVCLDFDIIEEAETLYEVEGKIKEAVKGYIINVHKNNLSDKLLNRYAEKKYWDLYESYLSFLKKRHNKKNETTKQERIEQQSSFIAMPMEELIREKVLVC